MSANISNPPSTQHPRHVWDLEELDMVKSLAYSEDGLYLACGGGNGVLWILEALTGRKVRKVISQGTFQSLSWFAVSGGHVGCHSLFCGLSSGLALALFIGGHSPAFLGYNLHTSSLEHIKLCNHNQTLVTASQTQVRVWSLSHLHSNSKPRPSYPTGKWW